MQKRRGWWADFEFREIGEPGGQDAADVGVAQVEGGEGGEVGDRGREDAGGGGRGWRLMRRDAHPREGKGCDHQPTGVDQSLGRNGRNECRGMCVGRWVGGHEGSKKGRVVQLILSFF